MAKRPQPSQMFLIFCYSSYFYVSYAIGSVAMSLDGFDIAASATAKAMTDSIILKVFSHELF